MQKVRSYYLFKFSLELLIKLLFQILPHGTFHYRLYIIFSLRGRFPFIQTNLNSFYFFIYGPFLEDQEIVYFGSILGYSNFILTNFRISFDLFS